MEPEITFDQFLAVDMRVGRIVAVEDFPEARKPAWKLRVDFGYSVYWLASDTDRWNNAGLRDPTGRSGSFLGHEADVRVRYKIIPRIEANVGYAYFTPGEFTRKNGKSYDSDFFYIELSFNAFE